MRVRAMIFLTLVAVFTGVANAQFGRPRFTERINYSDRSGTIKMYEMRQRDGYSQYYDGRTGRKMGSSRLTDAGGAFRRTYVDSSGNVMSRQIFRRDGRSSYYDGNWRLQGSSNDSYNYGRRGFGQSRSDRTPFDTQSQDRPRVGSSTGRQRGYTWEQPMPLDPPTPPPPRSLPW